MHLYFNYAIILDTQQEFVEWIEGTCIGTLITKGTIQMIEEIKNGGKKIHKEIVKEHFEEFKEAFVKACNPESLDTILEEKFFDAPNGKLKSQIACDSTYLNDVEISQ